jgi:AbrB family looped-hinge helix DNA binding protein
MMEARARVTSKGQVTVPVEVRRGLGIEEGDVLVFELAGTYATVRKRRSTLEVAEELRERYLAGHTSRAVTDREAIEHYFAAEWDSRDGGVVYESQGDGTFAGGEGELAGDDADR